MPAIYSPLMIQAGFGKQTAKNYVARLDGLTQYWQLSDPISLQLGDVVNFGFTGFENNGAFKRFFGSSDFILSLDTGTDGDKFRLRSALSATVNGSSITSDQTLIPTSGLNEVSVDVGATKDIETLLSLGTNNLLSAAIYGFKVVRSDTVIHEIPLTNKSQGATQLPTVGSVSATIINYTEAVWQDL